MMRFALVITILLLCLGLANPALAMMTEGPIGESYSPVSRTPQIDLDLQALGNSPGRVYGKNWWFSEIGQTDTLYFAGDTAAFGNFLSLYSKLKARPLKLIIHPAPALPEPLSLPEYKACESTPVKVDQVVYDWQFRRHLPDKPDKPEEVWLEVWGGGNVKTDRLKIPSAVHVAPPSDVEARITLIAKNNTITAGEPLLARIDLVNRSEKVVTLCMGNSAGSTTRLEVLDSKGKVLAATPKLRLEGDVLTFSKEIAAGQTYTQVWVVSGLYEFREPGDYTIRLQQLRADKEATVMSEDSSALRVLPRNAARLKARCEEIFLPLRNATSGKTDIPMSARTKALYSVRDESALPYLEWIAREWDGVYAIRAMRRIGTPEAKALVKKLSARDDSVGKAGKRAMAMSLDSKDPLWDINWY